jgi:hypothetical protein
MSRDNQNDLLEPTEKQKGPDSLIRHYAGDVGPGRFSALPGDAVAR